MRCCRKSNTPFNQTFFIKCHFFAILNLCYVMVDTVQRSISIQYNAFSATAALKNHSEWEETVKFKTITTDIKNIL